MDCCEFENTLKLEVEVFPCFSGHLWLLMCVENAWAGARNSRKCFRSLEIMTARPQTIRQTLSWIFRNLPVCSSGHMTPEIRLRLLTPECPLWTAQPEQCPFNDPYWAFYWPGGQALTRFIFDHPDVVSGKRILDFGSGCGASAIAARLCGAKSVVANDIDPVALLATALNGKLNGLKKGDLIFEPEDLLNTSYRSPHHWDLILVGDMCYDSEFSAKLLRWLKNQVGKGEKKVVIGDPGRHGLENARDLVKLTPLARYSLPEHMTKEHYGCSVADIHALE